MAENGTARSTTRRMKVGFRGSEGLRRNSGLPRVSRASRPRTDVILGGLLLILIFGYAAMANNITPLYASSTAFERAAMFVEVQGEDESVTNGGADNADFSIHDDCKWADSGGCGTISAHVLNDNNDNAEWRFLDDDSGASDSTESAYFTIVVTYFTECVSGSPQVVTTTIDVDGYRWVSQVGLQSPFTCASPSTIHPGWVGGSVHLKYEQDAGAGQPNYHNVVIYNNDAQGHDLAIDEIALISGDYS